MSSVVVERLLQLELDNSMQHSPRYAGSSQMPTKTKHQHQEAPVLVVPCRAMFALSKVSMRGCTRLQANLQVGFFALAPHLTATHLTGPDSSVQLCVYYRNAVALPALLEISLSARSFVPAQRRNRYQVLKLPI